MLKIGLFTFVIASSSLFAEASSDCVNKKAAAECQETYTVNLTSEESGVIEELITTIATTSSFRLALKVKHLKSISKKIETVSSSRFLSYVFENKNLINYMKEIKKSPARWKGLTKSLINGLKKEAEATTLFNDIPVFARHTRANAHVLDTLAKKGDYEGFIVHLLEQN